MKSLYLKVAHLTLKKKKKVSQNTEWNLSYGSDSLIDKTEANQTKVNWISKIMQLNN